MEEHTLRSEPPGEQETNERQEVESREKEERVNDDGEERTMGQESRTESEIQLDDERERWRDEGDGSLADDEDEDDDEDEGRRMSFTALVTMVRKTTEKQTEHHDVRAGDVRAGDVRAGDVSTHQKHTERVPREPARSRCVCCGEMLGSVLFLVAGVVMFPLLVWGGYELLPLELPVVSSAPFRLVYTLRCALFATFPIVLGVLVHGVSSLKFSSLNPLFEGRRASRHTLLHSTYVQDSLRLFLLFFLQLSVTSTYVQHHHLKLVPLLTIVFVFGRLIYWLSVCFSSTVRVLGFSLSFLPVLALMGLNLYFICSSTGEEAVFAVAPPTTPPPPKARWWG